MSRRSFRPYLPIAGLVVLLAIAAAVWLLLAYRGARTGEATIPGIAQPKPPPPDAVRVPGDAPFWRGHPDRPRPFGNPDTHPMRRIDVSTFHIARHETTVARYDACVADGSCPPRGDCGAAAELASPERPATCVAWADAAACCAWAGGRLPTEAEWEKAARGADARKYPWGNDAPTCERASYNACGKSGPDPVGSLPEGAGPSGVLDMAGNVAEWTADWYDEGYYARATAKDPAGPSEGSVRVVRGGSFATGARLLMTGYRSFAAPEERRGDVGFRCVWR